MKRVLLFILLFGSGLGLLFWLRPDTSNDSHEPSSPGSSEFNVSDREEHLITAPNLATGEDQSADKLVGIRASLSGRFEHVSLPKGDGAAIFTLTADDVSTAKAGWLDMTGVRLVYPDAGVVVAQRGRVAFDSTIGSASLDALDVSIELFDCELTLDPKHELAPGRFTASSLRGLLNEQVLTLSDGPEMFAGGANLTGGEIEVLLEEQRIHVTKSARAKMLGTDGELLQSLEAQHIELSSLGKIKRRLEASGMAVLNLYGDEHLVLSAPRVRVDGDLITLPEGDSFLPDHIEVADGLGKLTSGPAHVLGQHFDFNFNAKGQAEQVTVRGEAEVIFPAATSERVKLDQDVSVSSEGDINVTLGKRMHFSTQGLSIIHFGPLQLVAQRGLTGKRDEIEQSLQMTGKGGVDLDGELPPNEQGETYRVHYSADELSMSLKSVNPDLNKLELRSVGASIFEVNETNALVGSHALFEAKLGLTVDLLNSPDGTTWSIARAEQLAFQMQTSEVQTEGHADLIEDFKPEHFQLRGRNLGFKQVPLLPDSKEQALEAWGAHLVANGLEHLDIEGSTSRPAEISGSGFLLRGAQLKRTGPDFVGDGKVRVEFADEESATIFDCDHIVVEGIDLEADPIEARRIHATGEVVARTFMAGCLVSLRALEVEILRPEGQGEFDMELHTVGGAELGLRDGQENWVMRADSVDAFAREADDFFKIRALGNLSVSEEFSGFLGRGQLLDMERGTRSKLRLQGGEERAFVRGLISSNGGIYEGMVSELLIQDDRLDVSDLNGSVSSLVFPGHSQSARGGPVKLRCDHLSISTEEIVGQVNDVMQLDGEVVMIQEHPGELSDSFRAEHITFVHGHADHEPDQERKFDSIHTSIIAHGQVRFVMGAQISASGDHLEIGAQQHIMRFEGRPATLRYAGFSSSGSWVQINPVTMELEAGDGDIISDPSVTNRKQGSK